jgi:hypothetical protein
MICDRCGFLFKESETGLKPETEYYEYWGAPFFHTSYADCCPYCGSTDIEDGKYCDCGEPIPENQEFCEECIEEMNMKGELENAPNYNIQRH